MMTQPKCHAAAAQRMSVAESLGGEWTQKPASSDEAELIQGLPRSTKQCQGESGKTSPDDANHSGLVDSGSKRSGGWFKQIGSECLCQGL